MLEPLVTGNLRKVAALRMRDLEPVIGGGRSLGFGDSQYGTARRPWQSGVVESVFADRLPVSVFVPDVPGRSDLVALLFEESAELEVELGCPLVFGRPSGGLDRQLAFVVEPSTTVPVLRVDRTRRRLEAVGASLSDCTAALSLLRTMRRTGSDEMTLEPADSPTRALERIDAEIATTWPSFERTGIDWPAMSARLRPQADDEDLIGGMQRWVAALGDGHTNLHANSDVAALPYSAYSTGDGIVFADVPMGTSAWDAGVRPGHRLEGVDVTTGATVGAPAHLHPWLVGRRALSGPIGVVGHWKVRRQDGTLTSFSDEPGSAVWPQPIEWRRLDSGTGYLRIRRWTTADAPDIDTALNELAGCGRMLIDLRSNAGGQLVAATSFRRRFLDRPTRVGSVRYSTGDGTLSPHTFYDDEPSEQVRYTGRSRFVTNALTYSASEDSILGLNQLERVDIVGQPTGGGSGRPRTIPLIANAVLTISTAITYDHQGHCIEGTGIQPNRLLAVPDHTIDHADTDW